MQYSEGNEENGYSFSDFNKTKTGYSKEPNKHHKNNQKKEILQVITKNFMERLLDMVKKKHIRGTE
jgi:hypothetical protein